MPPGRELTALRRRLAPAARLIQLTRVASWARLLPGLSDVTRLKVMGTRRVATGPAWSHCFPPGRHTSRSGGHPPGLLHRRT